jgi:hypothetical protein
LWPLPMQNTRPSRSTEATYQRENLLQSGRGIIHSSSSRLLAGKGRARSHTPDLFWRWMACIASAFAQAYYWAHAIVVLPGASGYNATSRFNLGGVMPMNTNVTPVAEAEVVTPQTAPDDQALQAAAKSIAADSRTEPHKYLEEVRVAVGGE